MRQKITVPSDRMYTRRATACQYDGSIANRIVYCIRQTLKVLPVSSVRQLHRCVVQKVPLTVLICVSRHMKKYLLTGTLSRVPHWVLSTRLGTAVLYEM